MPRHPLLDLQVKSKKFKSKFELLKVKISKKFQKTAQNFQVFRRKQAVPNVRLTHDPEVMLYLAGLVLESKIKVSKLVKILEKSKLGKGLT